VTNLSRKRLECIEKTDTEQERQGKMEDEKILDLYFARNQRAINETQDKYGTFCGSIAKRILRNPEDAEECVNDTWYRAWNAIPPARPTRFSAYLAKITRNLSLNLLTRENAKKRGSDTYEACAEELEEALPARDGNVEETVDAVALGKIVSGFLREQNETARRVFVQRYFYFETVEKIAADSQLSESGVRMSLLRSRKALRDVLIREGLTL
jgi:RNA polymerase sigma-70 factor (ECF subfamily)